MTPLIVIQARLGSKRLPGKILLPLGPEGKPVLQHVVERCQRTGYEVAIAIPEASATDPELWGWICGRGPVKCNGWVSSGPEEDVLFRYTGAQHYRKGDWDPIVRITADCPLVDPQLIDAAVQAVRDGADYAGNTVERHWPRGCDVECFTTELLQRAHQNATDRYDREHVTPWMQRWAASPMALEASSRPVEARTEWRWTLDRLNDYRWLQSLWEAFPTPTLEQAAAYSRLYPPPVD